MSEADKLIKDKTILELPVRKLTKGGLILDWQGIQDSYQQVNYVQKTIHELMIQTKGQNLG